MEIISTFVFYDKGINGSHSSDESSNICLWEVIPRTSPRSFLAVFTLILARRAASAECTYYRWVKYSIFWPSVGGGAISSVSVIILVGYTKKKFRFGKNGSNSMPRAFVHTNVWPVRVSRPPCIWWRYLAKPLTLPLDTCSRSSTFPHSHYL